MVRELILALNDPDDNQQPFFGRLENLIRAGARGQFLLAVAGTLTSDIPGISAAGASPEDRRRTPAIDAELVMSGRAISCPELPVSPAGIVSPVVLTDAALSLLRMNRAVTDCGAFMAPQVQHYATGMPPANTVSSGKALDRANVERLFSLGWAHGRSGALSASYLVVAECVPGGTTTALGLFTALGYEVADLIATSLPNGDSLLRRQHVEEGVAAWKRAGDSGPLDAVAAVGDGMQAYVAGVVLSAIRDIPVVLAGGSQMLAVWALVSRIAERQCLPFNRRNGFVVSTRWIAFDRTANSHRLARIIGAPFAASAFSLRNSRHRGLVEYENGHVKEGVGAGAALALASLCQGVDQDVLLKAVDKRYEELVGHKTNETVVCLSSGKPE